MMFGPWGWVGIVLNLVIFAAVLIGIIWLIVAAIRRTGSNQSQANASAQMPAAPAGPTAKDILQARYARGEINREEYQQILADLSK